MQKNPPKARFIAGSAEVMKPTLAKVFNQMLKLVESNLKMKDLKHIRGKGVQRYGFC